MKITINKHPLQIPIIFGLFYLFAWVWIVSQRLTYPFDLEWMEGGQLMHAARLFTGKSIYVQPSTDFVPFFYTPGYPWVVAQLGHLFGGIGFTLGRSVSVLSTIWICGLIYFSIVKELKRHQPEDDSFFGYGFFGILLYLALFRTNGAFYDIARPDSFFLSLLFSSIFLLYFYEKKVFLVFSGLFLSAAFLSKQTSSPYFPLLFLYLCIWRNWRDALVFAVAVLVPSVSAVYLLNTDSNGEFWRYIFEGHQGHLFYWKNILLQYWRDLLFLAPILLLLPWLWFYHWAQQTRFYGKAYLKYLPHVLMLHWFAAYYQRVDDLNFVPHMYYQELFYENPHILILIPPTIMILLIGFLAFKQKEIKLQTNVFWLLIFVSGAGASGLNHSTQWAYSNCFMLISLSSSIFIPLLLKDLCQNLWQSRVLVSVLVLQLICWFYWPQNQVPQSGDLHAYHALKETLASVKGPIFVPAHPMMSWDRDQSIHTHQMGIQDVAFRGGLKDLTLKIDQKYWSAIVVDEHNYIHPALERSYYVGQILQYADAQRLRAKTGFLTRPQIIWFKQDYEQRKFNEQLTANYESFQRRYHEQSLGWYSESTQIIDQFRKENEEKGIKSDRLQLPTDWSIKPTKYPGQQGDFILSTEVSNLKYPFSLKSKVVIKSQTFKIENDLLTVLAMKITDNPKLKNQLEVRVWVQGKVVAKQNLWGEKKFQRMALRLSAYLGQEAYLEIIDEDEHGALLIDDWRWQGID